MESNWNRHTRLQPGVPDWMDNSDTSLARLVRQLRVSLAHEGLGGLPQHHVDLVLHEATAHAGMTSHPELWLPELAREKANEARHWWVRQQEIRARSAISFSA
jgi:hypothetical protein